MNRDLDPEEAGGVSNEHKREEPMTSSSGGAQGTMGTGKAAGMSRVEGAMGSNQRTSDGEGNAA